MYPYLGDFPTGATIFFPFHTFDSNGASVTLTGLAVTDIEVYKGASITQRSSDAGYALVDTDGIDIDSMTGIHGFTIDTSDNTDASFYAAGNEYTVIVSAVTIDAQTVRFIAGRFSIERSGGILALAKGASGFVALDGKLDTIDNFLDTEIAAILAAVDTEIAAILADTAEIGTAGAGLTAVPWNAAWDAEVQSEVNDALVVIHLDHLLAVAYDPASKPGVADALLNELVENDGGVARFTANSLENAPTGGGGGDDILASGTAQAGGASTITLAAASTTVDHEFALNGIRITGGTGAGQSRQLVSGLTASEVYTVNEPWAIVPDNTSAYDVYSNGISAASLQNIEDTIWDAARADHADAGSFGEYVLANIVAISDDATAASEAEKFFDGTAINLANVTIGVVTALTGHTAQTGDAFARLGAPAGASVSADVAAVKADTAATLVDTNELQGDWTNGGRLDNILDARSSQTSVDTVDGIVDTLLVNLATVDTVVDAVKVKTDQLIFSVTNQLDVNSLSINGVAVTGGSGTPWGRT